MSEQFYVCKGCSKQVPEADVLNPEKHPDGWQLVHKKQEFPLSGTWLTFYLCDECLKKVQPKEDNIVHAA